MMDVRILNDITKEQIALEVIVKTYVHPLFMAKKLEARTFNKIKDEVDVLIRKKKKSKEQTLYRSDGNPYAKTPVGSPAFKNFPKAHAQKAGRPQERSRDSHEDVNIEIEEIREAFSQENSNLKDRIRQLNRDVYDLEKSLQNSRADADDLRRRLSELAGVKLRTNNPNRVELSDRFRPSNIVKMFTELFDNEWCDAFDDIGKPLQEERIRIDVLYGIVKSAFESCGRKVAAQEEQIGNILLDIVPDSNIAYKDDNDGLVGNLHTMLSDVRKRILPVSSVNVAKNYMEQVFPYFISAFDLKASHKKLNTFAERCIEMCWYMHMCDPPMGMSADDQQGMPFDKLVYKEYTRSIKDFKQPLVEYFVWPALYLNVGGNMVSKGVAQPGDGDVKKRK